MASPGEMVRSIAKVFGVHEKTVLLHDRSLAEAGLRTKGGRGRSAAKMTCKDVAGLIIAVAASTSVKDTVKTLSDYASLPSRKGETHIKTGDGSFGNNGNTPSSWNLSGFSIETLQKLPENHSFLDAISALIESAENGALASTINLLPVKEINNHKIPNFWSIQVRVLGPFPQAIITIRCDGFSEMHSYSSIPDENVDTILRWARQRDDNDSADLKQERCFTSKTIFAMGELLNPTK